MSIRSAIVKALATTAGYDLNGNGGAPEEAKALTLFSDSLGCPSNASFWPQHWDGTVAQSRDLSRDRAYAGAALAFICINYRAQKLQEPPLMVVEETDDGEQWIPSPIDGLLSRPNPDFAMRRLYEITSIYRDVTGRALWLKMQNNGRETASLYAFSGDQFTVESTDTRLFGKFRITVRGGQQIERGPEDVVFFPGIDPFNPLGSISLLDVALKALRLGDDLYSSSKMAIKNAIRPSGVISVPEVLNDAEFDQMQGQLNQNHAGPANVNKALLLTGGATWQNISWTLQEMMPTEVIAWVEATVCPIFQLHPALLGIKSGLENSPWSHLDTAKKMLYDEMAIPRWTADAEILTDQLLRDVDTDENHHIRFDVDSIPALQDDLTEKVAIAEKGLGFMTVDEKRGIMGLEPKGGELGETIFAPATWMPAEFLVEPPEPVPIPTALDPASDDEADPEPQPTTAEEE